MMHSGPQLSGHLPAIRWVIWFIAGRATVNTMKLWHWKSRENAFFHTEKTHFQCDFQFHNFIVYVSFNQQLYNQLDYMHSGPRYFFSVSLFGLRIFFTFFFTLKIHQNLLFFKMRLWGESNPKPLVMSQTTKPLDQRGMSCQKSDFNPW